MMKLKAGIFVAIFVAIVAAVAGYKGYQIGVKMTMADWNREKAEMAAAIAEQNKQIVNDRKKVKHENQNRDRDALVRHICDRGWVREPEQCAAYFGQVRTGVR